MYFSPRKKLFVDTAAEMFGDGATLTKAQTTEAATKAGVPFPTWFTKRVFKTAYGIYKLPSEEVPTMVVNDSTNSADENVAPWIPSLPVLPPITIIRSPT